jgi:hypothetical protein
MSFKDLAVSGQGNFPSTAPETLSETLILAGVMAGLFPQNAYQIGSKIVIGKDIGLPLTLSINAIHVVEGKLVLGVHAVAFLIKSSGRYRWKITKEDKEECVLEWLERIGEGWEVVGTSSFSMDDAKTAGWLGKDNWRKYPKDMLYKQALTVGGRRFAPDVMHGVYTEDEMPSPEERRGRRQPAAPSSDEDTVTADATFLEPDEPKAKAPAPSPEAQAAAQTVYLGDAKPRGKAKPKPEPKAEKVEVVVSGTAGYDDQGTEWQEKPTEPAEPANQDPWKSLDGEDRDAPTEPSGPIEEEEAIEVEVVEPVEEEGEDAVVAVVEEDDEMPDVDEDGVVVAGNIPRKRPENYTELLKNEIGNQRFTNVLRAISPLNLTVADVGERCNWSTDMEEISEAVTSLVKEHEPSA